MRILFYISIFVSGLITIAGFVLTNMLTAAFDPNGDNFVGGNGNPGLMFVLFPFLIILYFFFAMIFVFEKLHEYFKVKRNLFQIGYASLFIILFSFSVIRIIVFRNKINTYFEYEIGYLNPFSNSLFFNFWTFVACLCFSGFCSFFLKKNEQKHYV